MKTKETLMTTRELAAKWFSSKSYLKQHELSDEYFASRNPSLLTIEQVEKIWRKETEEGSDREIIEEAFPDLKPNQKQVVNTKEEYDYTKLPMNSNSNLPNWMNGELNQKQFEVGDTVKCLHNINFMYGEKHFAGNKYIVTEETKAYFNTFSKDYVLTSNAKQFKQFNPKLFKAYIDKFSKEDKMKAIEILLTYFPNRVLR